MTLKRTQLSLLLLDLVTQFSVEFIFFYQCRICLMEGKAAKVEIVDNQEKGL